MAEINDAVSGYVRATPGGTAALLNDPVFHMQAEMLRRVLAGVDAQLEADGVSDRIRNRAVRAVLFGDPDVDPYTVIRLDAPDPRLACMDIPQMLAAAAKNRDAMVRLVAVERVEGKPEA